MALEFFTNTPQYIDVLFHICLQHMLQIKKETVNILAYKVGNNAKNANFVLL